MGTKTIAVLGIAVFLAIVAISLLTMAPGQISDGKTTTTLQETAQQAPSESEAVSALESEWSDESDTVEIGEMI